MANVNFSSDSGDVEFRPSSESEKTEGERDLGERVSERASQAAESGKGNVAEGMHAMGDRLDDVADRLSQRGGMASRAGEAVRGASDALDSGADYVRARSFGEMRDDLRDRIRDHPLLSMGVAIGAGWVLRRILD